MRSEEQLQKTFEIFIDKDGTLNLVFTEDVHEEDDNSRQSEIVEGSTLKILKSDPDEKYNAIVDMLPLKKGGYISNHARNVYLGIAANKQLHKIAMVSSSSFLKTVINIMMELAGKSESMKWFDKRNEALAWLKTSDQ